MAVVYQHFVTVIFKRSPTPSLPIFFPLSNLISFDGCLERGLMTEMWGFCIHENRILSKDWLAKL